MTSVKLLARWLKMQQLRYDRALAQAMQARKEFQKHQQQLDYLQQVQSDYDCKEGTTIKSVNLAGRKNFQQFVQSMSDKQSIQVQQFEEKWKGLAEKLAAEKRKLQSIEKLLDRQMKKEQKKADRAEAKALDEWQAHRHTEKTD
ncbi:flagellar export protein FliJ [Endozoicomonas arenosclerae]|uniref:flagellar FliJ family protein n=1 Tax=Endozoicomonas arenosclerae TaxID=1633495 RepID=UPI000781734D|nr:flagellar export protein FliJ [Endozoicomonas arenosclerae]